VIRLGAVMGAAVKDMRGETYPLESGYGLYPTSGASDDYAYSRHFTDPGKTQVPGFTIECGKTFQPTWTEAEHVIREVSAALLAFAVEVTEASAAVTAVRGKDIALVRQLPGWGSIPVAFSRGGGNWDITNGPAGPDFIPSWAPTPGVRLVSGDYR
jgi:hypothetical protein